ncbi:hypothetical protein POVWA2_035090 [Plasmodium ovale wallikeri]|uniref:Uncharacterized protein n=1 Tax=Plasmodium ovale wallikeri TaxID=864142 RepID=A0A1A8Z0K7_PLAOA|nr:hypothetical protein POVWA1_035800 [Plasmodium ovale wallikeri]SBT38143.1 hypothetical protein POVWA2_035090 [Plasmodium ovale wallikeri]
MCVYATTWSCIPTWAHTSTISGHKKGRKIGWRNSVHFNEYQRYPFTGPNIQSFKNWEGFGIFSNRTTALASPTLLEHFTFILDSSEQAFFASIIFSVCATPNDTNFSTNNLLT